MKSFSYSCILSLSMALGANAAIFTSNFTSLGAPGSDVHGQDDWSINDTTDQFSFVANWNSSKAIGLGDASAVENLPSGSSVALSHGISATVGETIVNFDFALFDSSSETAFKNRDKFGISLTNAGSNVLSITFVPEVFQPVDPDDNTENDGNGAKWFVYYNAGVGPAIQLNMALYEGSAYDFLLDVSPNANPLLTDFMLSITGSNTLFDGAVGLSLDPTGGSDNFSINWAKNGANQYGSNLILVDNLSVIPEPSSSLLLCLAGLGLACRRKRA